MSTSIKVGIRNVQYICEGALILLADQPNLKPETINRLIDTYKKSHKKIIAGRYGDVVGNPVLFHQSLFQELLELKGDVGARPVVERHPEELETVEIPEEEILDVDRPQDFERVKSLLKNKSEIKND
jgi:molybdenum cofactor cytidylyltransferase